MALPHNPKAAKSARSTTKKIKAPPAMKKTGRGRGRNNRIDGFDVFISYSHDDDSFARKINNAFKERKVKTWIDYEQIKPGDTFVKKIEDGLTRSSSMILLISPSSMKSGWVEEEYITGVSLTKKSKDPLRLIPVLIANAVLPAFLSNRLWVDLRKGNKFEDQLELLTQTILRVKSGITKKTKKSVKVKKHLGSISFMTFFPEGLLAPIQEKLAEIRGAQDAVCWSLDNGFLQNINNSGAQLIRVFPEKLNELSVYVQNKPVVADELIDQLLNHIFLEEDPFSDVIELGFGRTVLLRDLVETTLVSKSHDSGGQNKICVLARDHLWHVINEDYYRVALEISDKLSDLCGFTSPEDIITKAKILARIGKNRQAVQLFDIYRGKHLFEDMGLDEVDRIDAAMSWAKALKDSGAAGAANSELLSSYDRMLRLTDNLLMHSKENESLLLMKADILNNRATQMAVYGKDTTWEKVRGDFNQVFILYEQINNPRRLIGALSNYVAHTIDRLEKKIPFKELLSLFNKYEGIADQLEPCEELFFYYYQRARLLKRQEKADLSKAIDFYKLAYAAALDAGLKRRYPIAKRWELLLRRKKNEIAENDFLMQLMECADNLKSQTQDSWALNSLCSILIDLAQILNVRREPKRAWTDLVEAARYRIMQYAHSGSQRALLGLIDVLQQMDKVEVKIDKKDEFTDEHSSILNTLMGSPRIRALEWKSISQWLNVRSK